MPSQLFLDTFFPTEKISNLDNVPSFEPNCYRHVVTGNHSEKQAYQPFVSQISYSYRVSSMLTIFKATSTQRFMPGFHVVNSSSSVDRNPTAILHPIKPDISVQVYRDDAGPNVITDLSLVEMFIEFKWYPRDDPFCTVSNAGGVKKSFLYRTTKANDTLGQITIYAAAQLGSQFRTHAFSVFTLRDKARIIRWDRSGTIVTESIDINSDPQLAKFFRCYSKAPAEMRGLNQSVLDPMPEEAIVARQVLGLADDVSLFKLEVPCNDSVHYFVTPTPQATFYMPPGRATRGFQVYDISRATRVFLKDTWRIDLEDIHVEGLTYEILDKARSEEHTSELQSRP